MAASTNLGSRRASSTAKQACLVEGGGWEKLAFRTWVDSASPWVLLSFIIDKEPVSTQGEETAC